VATKAGLTMFFA